MENKNKKHQEIKKSLIYFSFIIIISFIHFAYFSISSKMLISSGNQSLSIISTLLIFLNVGSKFFAVYLFIFILNSLITFQYYFLLPSFLTKYRISKFILLLFLTYLLSGLFIIRQSIYVPGLIESYILKGNIPFFHREYLFFLTQHIPLKAIDYSIILILVLPLPLLTIKYSSFVINKFSKLSTWIIIFVLGAVLSFLILPYRSSVVKDKGTNLLFIGIDSLRPDHLSYNRNQRATTPNIDKILKKSIYFKNAYTVLPRTSPSLTSLFTGLNPNIHGIRHMFPRVEDRSLHFDTIAKIMNNYNYNTSVIADYAGEFFDNVKLGFANKDVPKGFSYYSILSRNIIFQHPMIISFFWGWPARWFISEVNFLPIFSIPSHILNKAIVSIKKSSKKKRNFFMTIFLSSVHIPYTITAPYYNMWSNNYKEGANRFAFSKREIGDLLDNKIVSNPYIESAQVNLLYDRALRLTDDHIGFFLKWLKHSKVLDNTIILFFSDHGENLPTTSTNVEHGTFLTKKNDDLKIFLALFLPEKIQKKYLISPHEINERIRITDIAPTILSLLNIPTKNNFSGVNLLPLLQGKKNNFQNLPVFIENGLSFNSKVDYKDYNALTYPNIFKLIEIEDKFPYYFVLKNKYQLDIFQAKWRKIITNDGQLIYIPKKASASYNFINVAKPSIRNALKRILEKNILLEPATIMNGNNNIEYKN